MLNLDHLAETTFYYPCSGRDWEVPLRLSGPHVKHLRFVDPNFRRRLSNHRGQLLSRGFSDRIFRRREITGDLTQPRANYLVPNLERDLPNFKPCIASEVYQHVPTKREISIHWHDGDGRKTLDCFDEPIGVFFIEAIAVPAMIRVKAPSAATGFRKLGWNP